MLCERTQDDKAENHKQDITENESNMLMQFLKILASGGIILILFYILSLPVQVVSYFIISVINYFRKHKAGYIGLFKKYWSIVIYLLKGI